MVKIKKAGIIMTIAGVILAVVSIFDLFGAKHLPIPLTVTVMLLSIASVFLGPAFLVFPLPAERRKKISRNSFVFSFILIGIGVLFKFLHFPSAGIQIIVGVLIFCFFYGSLAFKSKYEKWRIYTRSKFDALFLSLFDFVGIGALSLGFLFKLQHWPLAMEMTFGGMGVLVIGTLAWNQKFKKEVIFRKETEDKLKESFDKIELQHQALEEKQKEIIDSITYAKRIQNSLMPTEKYIDGSIKRLKKDNN